MISMKVINKFLSVLLLASIITACKRDKVGVSDYLRYFHTYENGLVKEKEYTPLKFVVTYANPDLMAIFQGNAIPDSIESKRSQIEDLAYFIFKISSEELQDPLMIGISDQAAYQKRLQYAYDAIASDFTLICKEKEYPCRQVIFEPSHGINHEIRFSIAFDKPTLEQVKEAGLKVVYDDKLYGLGRMKFSFKAEDLNAIPQLML